MGDGGGWGGGDHGYVAPAQFGRHAVALPFHGDTGGVAAWAEQVISGHPTLLEDGQVQLRASLSLSGLEETAGLMAELSSKLPGYHISYMNLETLA